MVSRPRINQVNLKSTTGQTSRVPIPAIDFRGLALALKVSAESTLLIFNTLFPLQSLDLNS